MHTLAASPAADLYEAPDIARLLPGFGDALAIVLLAIGSVFCFLAVVGILRMPDLYTRMQAATKAGTLGVACIILGVASHFGAAGVAVEALLIVAFLFLTTPIASHLIARAAYFVRVPIWENTWRDDLHGRYDEITHDLQGDGSIDVDPDEIRKQQEPGRPAKPKRN
ncbi:MAG: monovalent cation/H(+) antiporter subunit G [Phycisphaerales bacterium]|nr:MAG: monovalent cation/H(+) antiporter subunit G [Phycisphaerales bacterium]